MELVESYAYLTLVRRSLLLFIIINYTIVDDEIIHNTDKHINHSVIIAGFKNDKMCNI